MTDHLLVDHQDGITTLTMNRPEVLNALSMDMRLAMFDAMDAIEHDPKVRCVVLRGAGGNFMAGGDVKSFAEDYAHLPAAERQAIFERRIHSLHPMMMQIRRMKKPMLASVEGAAAVQPQTALCHHSLLLIQRQTELISAAAELLK